MTRPLDGVLVISLEQAIAAPYCTRLLADQGARVIKVERPDGGDFARGYDTRAKGLSSHFVWTNRAKESLTLDLKSPQAVQTLKSIIAKADIFVQNLAPGAVNRLGLDPADLRSANQRLITCSISGYGQGGPMENAKAYDLLIQAEAGFLSVTGTADHMSKAGISVADIAAGVTAYQSLLASLLQRHNTGTGDHVEVSMLEAMAEWMGFPMNYAMDGANPPSRNGAGHATIYPYGPYDTADGSLILGLQNTREWVVFAQKVLMRADLAADKRFTDNSGRLRHKGMLDAIITNTFASLSTDEALARLQNANIATARINDMAALWAHPQLAARERWAKFGSPNGPIKGLKPICGDGWTPQLGPVPALGEHTDKILTEFAPATDSNPKPGKA